MSSKPSIEFYSNIKEMSPIRAIAETLVNSSRVRYVTAREAYEMARTQPGVSETDLPIYPKYAKALGLAEGAKVLNDCHGNIVGRTANARRFYSKMNKSEMDKVEGDLREAVFQLEQYDLIKSSVVIGMDPELMIKATFVTTTTDAVNLFNWLTNFVPWEIAEEQYKKSRPTNIQDIILVAFNEWTCNDPYYNNVGQPQLALVDEKNNVIVNLGMRYFGERKKGTLTLAWTSGIRMGMAACHGGIKEIDFSECTDPQYRPLGKKSIAFYGLSGTGKSSHTNSHDNGKTLPAGFKKVVLHDDAFQIDMEKKVCRAWEPSLFDKTDSREIGNPDWNYVVSLMNHTVVEIDGKKIPVGQDIRNSNGRAILDRDLLGDWVNTCSFPKALIWLMKDTILPPVMKIKDNSLAVALGAALITKRNKAENVTEEELKKLAFVPFANPFRVYELYKDVEAFGSIFETGAECYAFNSGGYWKASDTELEGVSLQTSLTLQTAILTNSLEWEDWYVVPGAMIPTRESVEKILPGYYDKYDPRKRQNLKEYETLVIDRFQQRKDFIKTTDIASKPEMLDKMIHALDVKF